MATVKTILKKTRTEAVIKFVGTGTASVTLAELALDDETVSAPVVDIHHALHSGGVADNADVTRNAVDILRLTGNNNWEFNGYSLNDQNTADLAITLSANTTLILIVRKLGGYTSPGRSEYLTGGA